MEWIKFVTRWNPTFVIEKRAAHETPAVDAQASDPQILFDCGVGFKPNDPQVISRISSPFSRRICRLLVADIKRVLHLSGGPTIIGTIR
jgi:hypothetical protein